MTLEGRTALVTGAGRGIGRAIALELAAQGAAVAVTARTESELRSLADEITGRGGTAHVMTADLADVGTIAPLAERAQEALGSVDVLVNNAAVIWPLGPGSRIDPADYAAAIAINVSAPAALSFALMPGMLSRSYGRIVNVSSGAADFAHGMIGGNAYVVSKKALETHTINLAAELQGTGITVNAYRPGTVETTMQQYIRGQDPAAIGENLHGLFQGMHDNGVLGPVETPARDLVARIATSEETGEIWDVGDGKAPAV